MSRDNVTAPSGPVFATDQWLADPNGPSQIPITKVMWGARDTNYRFVDFGAGIPVQPDTGTTWNVSGAITSSALPANAAQEGGGHLASIDAKTPALGPAPAASSIPVALATDQGPLQVLLSLGEQLVSIGRQLAAASVPVVLAVDHPVVPVAITDGLDTIGTTARPVRIDPIGTTPQPVTIAQPVSVTGAATLAVAPSNTTQAPLFVTLTDLPGQQQMTGFVPVPEILPPSW
jgi:hypothetical protein